MANAVFNSLESYFNNNKIKANVSRSVFDLSNIRTFDTSLGALIPFYLEDCLPNDDFEIKNVVKVQALPLSNPLFSNFRVYTYYFYVPYILMWHKFDKFLEGGKDGTYTCELPQVSGYRSSVTFDHNSLGDYLGFPLGSGLSGLNISAFPFCAYNLIYKHYFLDQDLQTVGNVNAWFPEDDDDFCLKDGANNYLYNSSSSDTWVTSSDNFANNGLGYIFAKNYRKDYFTSALISPQRGPKQMFPIQGELSAVFPWDSFVEKPSGFNANIGFTHIDDGSISGYDAFTTPGTTGDARERLRDLFNNNKVPLNNSIGFSLDDLRVAVKVQEWLERNMRVKAQYKDFLDVHFNDSPTDERLTKPYYIGGTVQNLTISEVLQTSQSTSGTDKSYQGTATGRATSFDSGYVGKFHSHEYGLIMGICCIMPDTYYSDGLDRHWSKETRFDFYFPEFAQLSPQAILNKELRISRNPDIDNAVFGYIGRFDEYRHHRSMAVGSLRNPNQEDFYSWTLSREFSNTPSLTSNAFISTSSDMFNKKIPFEHPTYRTDYFPTKNTVNPFIVQVGINVRAVRPLPYVNVPQGIL